MVQKIKCECAERFNTEVNSFNFFQETKKFFQEQVDKKNFYDLTDYKKVWYLDGGREKNIYKTTVKYYKCNVCGCLWEFRYPEFPACGFVRKFEDGVYSKMEN